MADESRQSPRHGGRAGRPGRDEPTLTAQPHEPVGELLRRTRETYGLHLQEVSESLRIRYAYLDAIERSAFEDLPGPTYAVGFVRGYAQFLGLDDDAVVGRFKEESQGLKKDQELHFPEPVNEGKMPGGTVLVLSLALIAGAYGAWSYLSSHDYSASDLVPEVPERLQRMVGLTERPPVPEATDLDGEAGEFGEARASADRPEGAEVAEGADGAEGPDGGGPDGALETRQVADLPETSPDMDQPAAAPDDSGTGTGTGTDVGEGGGAGTAPADDVGGAAPTAPAAPAADGGSGGDRTQAEPAASQAAAPEGATGQPSAADRESAAATETAGAAGVPAAPEAGTENAGTENAGTDTAGRGESQTDSADAAGRSETASAETAASSTGSAEEAGPPPQEDAGQENAGPPAAPESERAESGIPAAPGQTQTAAAGQGDQPNGRTFGANAADARVTLAATARSWVQVRGPDDSLVLTRLLRPGDRYHVPDRDGLTLHTGNAGGLEVWIDGRKVGRLGDDGEVRRGILLDPGALQAGG